MGKRRLLRGRAFAWTALCLPVLCLFSGCLPGDLAGEDAAMTGPVVNPKDYGASGSASAYWGSAKAGSKTLILTGLSDFRNGQGIVVFHAGPPCKIAGIDCSSLDLPAPLVSACARLPNPPPTPVPDQTTYSYRIAALDGRGGMTAAGAPSSVTASLPTASKPCIALRWAPVNEASAYAIYRSIDHQPFRLISLTQGRPAKDPSRALRIFEDADANHYPSNESVASAAPDFSSADHLVTKVAGVSTGMILLEKAPSIDAARARVIHDDTRSFREALSAAAAKTLLIGQGTYLLSGPLQPPQGAAISGGGAGSSLKRSDFYEGAIFHLGAGSDEITLRKIGYDGNGGAFEGISGPFISLGGSQRTVLKNLMVKNFCGPAVSGSGSDLSLSGSFIAAGSCAEKGVPAINLETGDQIKLENNRLIGAVNSGEAGNLSMENNEVEGNLYVSGSGFWIWNNFISGTAVLSGSGSFGQNRLPKLAVSAPDKSVSGIEIEDNIMTGSGSSGLDFWTEGPNAQLSAVSVLNNRWTGKPEFAVAFPPEIGAVSGISFEGNFFSFRRDPYSGKLPRATVGQLAKLR